MPRIQVVIIAFLVVIVIIGILLLNRTPISEIIIPSPLPSVTVSATSFPSTLPSGGATQKPSSTATPKPPSVSQVKIYLIAINDQGKSGTKIGCGDSVVAASQQIAPTTMPLTAALNNLLNNHSQYYGQSGLYNALYQSTLKVDNASVNDGVATVHLSGTLQLGGECDNPRVEAQLTQTVMQFSTVKTVNIYVNGKTLQEALSLK